MLYNGFMKGIYSNFFVTLAETISLTLLCFSSPLLNITTASAQITSNFEKQQGVATIRDAVSTLITVLRSENIEARINAARALGGMGTQAKLAEPALMVALNDKEARVRYSAATALANLGGETKLAFPELLKAVQSESKWIRNDAAYALSNLALNMQTKARQLSTKELNQAIADLGKTLEVMESVDISPQVVKSIGDSLDSLKRERQRGNFDAGMQRF